MRGRLGRARSAERRVGAVDADDGDGNSYGYRRITIISCGGAGTTGQLGGRSVSQPASQPAMPRDCVRASAVPFSSSRKQAPEPEPPYTPYTPPR